MEAHVEEVGPCKRKITVQVPAEDVKDKFDENYENLRKNIELPGFRRGHVPRRLMERRFGEDVAKEVRQNILDDSFKEAVDKNELDVIGAPRFNEEELAEASADQPFCYTVTVEIRPEFELPNYTSLTLEKPPVEPTDTELQTRIDFYRRRMATLEVIEEGAQPDDVLTADVDFKTADEVIWKREGISLLVRSDEVAGVPIENLSDELAGTTKGDVKTFDVTLPDTFHLEDHREKEVTVSVEVKEVKRPLLPDATDEWASDIGFDSLEELKEELGKQIGRAKESDAREKMKLQIRDQLADMVQMGLPEDLLKRVSEENAQRRKLMLQYQDLSEEEIEEKMAEQTEQSEEETIKNVKLYFIFDDIAKQETILVTEDEVRARVEQLAINYSMDAERLFETMDTEGRLASLRKDILDEKIVDFLISKASIEQAEAAPTDARQASDKPEEAAEEASEEG